MSSLYMPFCGQKELCLFIQILSHGLIDTNGHLLPVLSTLMVFFLPNFHYKEAFYFLFSA